MSFRASGCALVLATSGAGSVFAHHSPAAYDMTTESLVAGTIVDVAWKNPHIYFTIRTLDAGGGTRQQEFEAASIASLQPHGLTRDVLASGRSVVVRAHPARSGDGEMLGLDFTTEDGTLYRLHPRGRGGTQESTAMATSLEGQWLPSPATFLGLQQAVNGASLTGAARAAQSDTEGLAAAQASCAYFPPPMRMVASYIHTIAVTAGTVIISTDGVPEARVVYLDGRVRDPGAVPTHLGFSIGRWEDDALVIETTGFLPSPEGVGFRVPSGSGKRLLERLSLSADRRQLVYEATVLDPEFLEEPLSYRGTMDYRPDAVLSGVSCDEENARRFRER